MVVTSTPIAVGGVHRAFADGKPAGEDGAALERAFPRFADDLAWWTEAARAQHERTATPY
jgi:hypothetical protein